MRATNERDKHMRLMEHSFEAQPRIISEPIIISSVYHNKIKNKRRLLGILPKSKAAVSSESTSNNGMKMHESHNDLLSKRQEAVRELEMELENQREISTLMYRKLNDSRQGSYVSSNNVTIDEV